MPPLGRETFSEISIAKPVSGKICQPGKRDDQTEHPAEGISQGRDHTPLGDGLSNQQQVAARFHRSFDGAELLIRAGFTFSPVLFQADRVVVDIAVMRGSMLAIPASGFCHRRSNAVGAQVRFGTERIWGDVSQGSDKQEHPGQHCTADDWSRHG